VNLFSPSTGPERLTRREREITELVAQGLSHKETAARLGLAAGTVKVYLSHSIYPKLGVRSQGALIRYWIEKVEMPERGDCSTCCLRQAHLSGRPDVPLFE
jgi:DNA-binding NarL/FixJ family response regulator